MAYTWLREYREKSTPESVEEDNTVFDSPEEDKLNDNEEKVTFLLRGIAEL